MAIYDRNSRLWNNGDESFFRNLAIKPIKQRGPHCVSTVLAMLTNKTPGDFQGKMNTQDPSSWSDSLKPYGLKLAYCPTDIRKIQFYMKELINLDDLFTISYYTGDRDTILKDPDETGWICGSHIVILHRDQIIDPMSGDAINALQHQCMWYYTKRIFRVVPADHKRGL